MPPPCIEAQPGGPLIQWDVVHACRPLSHVALADIEGNRREGRSMQSPVPMAGCEQPEVFSGENLLKKVVRAFVESKWDDAARVAVISRALRDLMMGLKAQHEESIVSVEGPKCVQYWRQQCEKKGQINLRDKFSLRDTGLVLQENEVSWLLSPKVLHELHARIFYSSRYSVGRVFVTLPVRALLHARSPAHSKAPMFLKVVERVYQDATSAICLVVNRWLDKHSDCSSHQTFAGMSMIGTGRKLWAEQSPKLVTTNMLQLAGETRFTYQNASVLRGPAAAAVKKDPPSADSLGCSFVRTPGTALIKPTPCPATGQPTQVCIS